MKRKYFFRLLPLLYIISFFIGTIPAYGNMTPYSYEVIHPDNQFGDAGYYNLRMEAGQNQTVQLKLQNQSDEEVVVGISLNGAKTNSNGVLEYGPTAIENDKSLKYDFKEIVSVPESVTLPPRESVIVDLTINMPEATLDGILVGGIHLKKVPNEAEEAEMAEQTGVINEYAYLVGMVLSESDEANWPQADLELNDVYAGLENYRNAIYINYSNIQPNFLNEMSVEVEIMAKGSSEVIYDTKKVNLDMAPNSLINFPVMMNGERMEAGDYSAHILVTSGDQHWEWDREFKISKEEADRYNAQDISLVQERGIDWRLIAMIGGGVFLVFVLIFIIIRQVNKKKRKTNLKNKGNKKKGKKKS